MIRELGVEESVSTVHSSFMNGDCIGPNILYRGT